MRRPILLTLSFGFLLAETVLAPHGPLLSGSGVLDLTYPRSGTGERVRPAQEGVFAQAQAQAPSTPPEAGPAPASETSSEPAPASAPAPAPAPAAVDLTALRYFARAGDQRRLDAEIARLRALYPDWVPPEDPLDIPEAGDPELDALWALYAQGRYGEVREGIAARQVREPDWTAPADLLDRLQVSENRERLLNASQLDQNETVVRIASETPSLLTCAEVDVMWRVARAFAATDRAGRALDVYRYLLQNCDDTGERLASIQMAGEQLDRAALDELLALEREGPDGVGEFEPIRLDLARQSVAAAGADPEAEATPDDLARLEASAEATGSASDFMLVGWYRLTHGSPEDAEAAFRRAYEVEETPEAARGLSLALVDLDRFADAEEVARPYAEAGDDNRDVYAAAAANLLAQLPPPDLSAEQLQTIVTVTAELADANLAQQLGWYAYALNQFTTADQWFASALGWAADEEPAAFGRALVRQRVGDLAGLQSIQAQWSVRSPRIAQVGQAVAPAGVPAGVPPLQVAAQPQAAVAPAAQPLAFAPGAQPAQSIAELQAALIAQAQALQPLIDNAARAAQPQTAVAQPAQAPAQAPVQPQPVAAAPAPAVIAAPVATTAQTQPLDSPEAAPSSAPVSVARAVGPVAAPAGSPATADCRVTRDPRTLTPETALPRGWCLMEIDRPLEAAPAFEVALLSSNEATRRDAAYGQSLAYLRAGLSDRAAVAATKAPQSRDRQLELEIALLTDQATDAFEAKRPVEALLALDERARIAPERIDLMILRGYAYLELRRFAEAEQVFAAAARAGSTEGRRGVNAVREARGIVSTGG